MLTGQVGTTGEIGSDDGPGQGRERVRKSLVALCVAVNVAEAVVTMFTGLSGGASVAAQAAAPAPIGLFGDLRWLLLSARSWPTFAVGVCGVLVVRSLLTAAQAHLASGRPSPSFSRLLARAFTFDLLVGLLLVPFALILYAFADFPVSWLYIAAVPATVVLALLVFPASFTSRWWRAVPGWRPTAWVALTVVAVTAAAGIVSADPIMLAVPVAAAAGVFEAVAWTRIVGATQDRSCGRFVPLLPAAVAIFLAGSVIAAATGFSAARVPTRPVGAGPSGPPQVRGRVVVLLVEGFSSHWDGSMVPVPSVPPGSFVSVFSYRGLTPSGTPEPYTAIDTHSSLSHLAVLMADQIDALARASGLPVKIVAVSEGSAVAETYLAGTETPPVDTVVLVSPLLHPGAVSLPPNGRGGPGEVAAKGLAVLSSWLAPIATVDLSPDQPFLRSLLQDRPGLSVAPPCATPPCPRPRELVLVPLADTVDGAPPQLAGAQTVVFAGFHGGDFSDGVVRGALQAVLAGRTVRSNGAENFLSHVISGLASAWRVPTPARSA